VILLSVEAILRLGKCAAHAATAAPKALL
jgi:hypothetical protein